MKALAALLVVTILLGLSQRPAAAQSYPHCPPGQTPAFHFGFRALADVLGERMGEPIDCEDYVSSPPDVLQRTTTGLAYYRASSSVTVFTNGTERWALTEDGLVYWTGPSLDVPTVESVAAQVGVPVSVVQRAVEQTGKHPAELVLADIEAAQASIPSASLAPTPEPPPPAAEVTPESKRLVVVTVGGYGSDLSSTEDNFAMLQARLHGTPFFPFSYSGGTWEFRGGDWWWTPKSYTGSDTEQSLDESAAKLLNLVRRLNELGNRVAVVGFSLGGAVAYHSLYRAFLSNDSAALPYAVVTIASPLHGIDAGDRRGACGKLALSFGIVGALVTGGLGGAIGAGLIPAAMCPSGMVIEQLEAIYTDRSWRSNRDRVVISSAKRAGVKLFTMGSEGDCLYFFALCSDFLSGFGADVRWTTVVQGADRLALYSIPHRFSGWGEIPDSHEAILVWPEAIHDIGNFLDISL